MVAHIRIRISPYFGKGSGLKLVRPQQQPPAPHISPYFGKGSGLKLGLRGDHVQFVRISPYFGKGSGLKQEPSVGTVGVGVNLPLLR